MRKSEITFLKDQKCGPFILDFFIPEKNLVLEICPDFQFYVRTKILTANARWRHTLIRAMGFRLVILPDENWRGLADKEAFLISILDIIEIIVVWFGSIKNSKNTCDDFYFLSYY